MVRGVCSRAKQSGGWRVGHSVDCTSSTTTLNALLHPVATLPVGDGGADYVSA